MTSVVSIFFIHILSESMCTIISWSPFSSKEIENGSLYWKFGYKFSRVAYF